MNNVRELLSGRLMKTDPGTMSPYWDRPKEKKI
jgi:hypothetical protein